jgi:single-strand DNA-binding protein
MIHAVINGNLGADPELKTLPDGTSVVRLRVASSHRAKVGGEWTDVTTWVSVDVWGRRGETLARLLSKGSKVSVRGTLAVREYAKKDGSQGYSVDVRADEVELMGGPRREDGARAPAASSAEPAADSYSDEIPF